MNKIPSFSNTVAYLLLAKGHTRLSHRPVRLYSFLQTVSFKALIL